MDAKMPKSEAQEYAVPKENTKRKKKRVFRCPYGDSEDDVQHKVTAATLREVKIEKEVAESNAQEDRIMKMKKKHTAQDSKGLRIKKGMEVGLTSPNSARLIALGTVQNTDNGDYIQVLVNVVLDSTTVLPIAFGRVTEMGNAQSLCIPWPKSNIKKPDMTPRSARLLSEMDSNLRIHSKPKKPTEKDSQDAKENPVKKRKLTNANMREAAKFGESQK